MVIVLALVAAIGALVSTSVGLQTLVGLAGRLAPIRVEAVHAQGALTREFGFERLRIEVGGTSVEIVGLRGRLEGVSLRPLRVGFQSLSAARVDVQVRPGDAPAGPPESIASPVAVSTGRLNVGELRLGVGAMQLTAHALDVAISLGPQGYEVLGGRFDFAGQPMTIAGRLGGSKPFALSARGDARTALQVQTVRAQWRAEGSLLAFTLAAEVSGGQARGNASARIGSFDQPPIKSLHADIEGIDLSAWRKGLPVTRLRVRADLQPGSTMERLTGAVQIVNTDLGRIDAGKLPVREAKADVVLTRESLTTSGLVAELARGRASGTFAARFGAAADWQTQLRLDGVDPAAIHGRARSLLLDGTIRAQQDGAATLVHGALANRGPVKVSAVLDLRLTPERLDLERAVLALGAGRAEVSGSLGLKDEQRLSAKGTVEKLDPGLLVKGLDARISGGFSADAQLLPQPRGLVRFDLRDSLAFGRPLTGRGVVQLDAAEQLAVDVQLAVRSARFSAQGGLGTAGRNLAIALDVPALEELVPQVRGGLKADLTLSGSWRAPAVEGRATATELRLGDHTVRQLQASASYSGGADGRLSLHADAANHTLRDKPALSVRNATLSVEGQLSDHAIALRGAMANAQEVALQAQGGWSGQAWRGVLREARAGQPIEAHLLAPSPLKVGPEGFEFGPARVDIAGALVEELAVAGAGDTLRTSGRFSGLRPQALAARTTANGSRAVAGTPADPDWLTLRGEWRLQLGTQADGMLRVERSGGYLYPGGSSDAVLRISELRLEANLNASRLEAFATAVGAGGSASAQMVASVEHSAEAGWRLAQARPWQVKATADLPKLALLSALLSESLRGNLRVDGSLAADVTVEGTPAEPQARGTLNGDGLRAAWVEQGLRLEDGRLRARLDGDILILDELRFAGPPRVRPKEPQAAARVDFKQDGTVSATGRVKLRDLEGVIQVTARRLPMLQRSERWVIASGDLQVETSMKRVQLTGNLTALAGYVEAIPAGLPSLSTDVVVSRAGGETVQPARRLELGFDVGINLGDSFYVRGLGVSARMEGSMRLRSAGRGAVTASGAIEAKDGRYEGFGQKLEITRGRLNFQGPPENPAIDVLALRRGLPVEVGVSITRTVKDPLVRLYSDPAMAESETMSWLVLGHAGDQSQADRLVLLQTAQGLLSRKEGGSVTGQIAQTLGMDDISLRSGELRSASSLLPKSGVAGELHGDDSTRPTATTQILSVSKRLSDSITLGYEQALTGSENVLQLGYRISQRLRLVARAGSENALDLVYSFAFD
ncbi:MAG TPA: translocation/assembly module TamB domain-containing protein [Ramlibacter sp.]|nr:translocation/assembly module TamB domain-containing protein [Ramlibacter sp.]